MDVREEKLLMVLVVFNNVIQQNGFDICSRVTEIWALYCNKVVWNRANIFIHLSLMTGSWWILNHTHTLTPMANITYYIASKRKPESLEKTYAVHTSSRQQPELKILFTERGHLNESTYSLHRFTYTLHYRGKTLHTAY